MQEASRGCYKALMQAMSFIVATRGLGFTFQPDNPNSWDGKKGNRIFVIMSANAGITYLEGAIVK